MTEWHFDDLEPFHPAMHFSDDCAYYGINLERDVEVRKGPNKGEHRRQPTLAFVTSRREILEPSHEALRSRGLMFAGEVFPAPPDPRFSRTAIAQWINGETSAVNADRLYDLVRTSFTSRVEFPRGEFADVCALFVFGSYLYRLFEAFPYLVFRGSKAAGKSKTLKLIGGLAFNAIEATALTGGALYLEVEAHGATLLLDDAEDLGDEESRALKAMLNCGYKHGGTTIRGDWERQASRRYSVYSPKVITTIRGVDDTLASRCITVQMQPSIDASLRDRSEEAGSTYWRQLRDYLYVWAMREWQDVRDSYTSTTRSECGLEALSGRSWELWRPLIAVARHLEARGAEGLVKRAVAAALDTHLEAQTEEVDSREGTVLTFLLSRYAGKEAVEISPKHLAEDLIEQRGEKTSARSLGWTFRRLGWNRFKGSTADGAVLYRVPYSEVENAALRRNLLPPPQNSENAESPETPVTEPPATGVSDVADFSEFSLAPQQDALGCNGAVHAAAASPDGSRAAGASG